MVDGEGLGREDRRASESCRSDGGTMLVIEGRVVEHGPANSIRVGVWGFRRLGWPRKRAHMKTQQGRDRLSASPTVRSPQKTGGGVGGNRAGETGRAVGDRLVDGNEVSPYERRRRSQKAVVFWSLDGARSWMCWGVDPPPSFGRSVVDMSGGRSCGPKEVECHMSESLISAGLVRLVEQSARPGGDEGRINDGWPRADQ